MFKDPFRVFNREYVIGFGTKLIIIGLSNRKLLDQLIIAFEI